MLSVVSASRRSGAEEVTTASGQFSNVAQQISGGSARQAAALDETSASFREIGSMVSRSIEDAGRAAALMGEASNKSKLASEGTQKSECRKPDDHQGHR